MAKAPTKENHNRKKKSFNSLLYTICAIAVRFQTICMQQFVAHWNMVFSLTETIDKKSSERAQMLRFDVITYYTFQFCNISTTDKINSTFFFFISHSFSYFFIAEKHANSFTPRISYGVDNDVDDDWVKTNSQSKWNEIT